MVEYVKLKPNKSKVLNDKQRTNLILFTYMLNFNLFLVLFNVYDNFILKWLTFFLVNSFAFSMLARQTNIGSLNGWAIIYCIINGFGFGITSMIFSYNLFVIGINLLYFRYIVKKVNLKE